MLYNPRACLRTVRASNFPTHSFTSVQTVNVPAIKIKGAAMSMRSTRPTATVWSKSPPEAQKSGFHRRHRQCQGQTASDLGKDLKGGHRYKRPSAPMTWWWREPPWSVMSPPVRPISVPPSERYARNSGEPTPPPIRVRPSPPASPVRRPPTPGIPPDAHRV